MSERRRKLRKPSNCLFYFLARPTHSARRAIASWLAHTYITDDIPCPELDCIERIISQPALPARGGGKGGDYSQPPANAVILRVTSLLSVDHTCRDLQPSMGFAARETLHIYCFPLWRVAVSTFFLPNSVSDDGVSTLRRCRNLSGVQSDIALFENSGEMSFFIFRSGSPAITFMIVTF